MAQMAAYEEPPLTTFGRFGAYANYGEDEYVYDQLPSGPPQSLTIRNTGLIAMRLLVNLEPCPRWTLWWNTDTAPHAAAKLMAKATTDYNEPQYHCRPSRAAVENGRTPRVLRPTAASSMHVQGTVLGEHALLEYMQGPWGTGDERSTAAFRFNCRTFYPGVGVDGDLVRATVKPGQAPVVGEALAAFDQAVDHYFPPIGR
jgi:hypothetical protein